MALVGDISPVKERLVYFFQALPDLLEALLHNNPGWMEIEKIRVQSAVRMAFLSLGGVFVDFFSLKYTDDLPNVSIDRASSASKNPPLSLPGSGSEGAAEGLAVARRMAIEKPKRFANFRSPSYWIDTYALSGQLMVSNYILTEALQLQESAKVVVFVIEEDS
jgi:hypothetical protein